MRRDEMQSRRSCTKYPSKARVRCGLEEPRNLGFIELINRASPYDANKFISAIFICVSRQRQLDLQTVSH